MKTKVRPIHFKRLKDARYSHTGTDLRAPSKVTIRKSVGNILNIVLSPVWNFTLQRTLGVAADRRAYYLPYVGT